MKFDPIAFNDAIITFAFAFSHWLLGIVFLLLLAKYVVLLNRG